MVARAALFVLLLLIPAGAQESSRRLEKPLLSRAIDGGVRDIPGYQAEAPLADDGEFLRRLMLDLAGYPPTGTQARQFMDDRDPDKRLRKIDALLDSEDFADLWGRKFAAVYFEGTYHDVEIYTQPLLSEKARKKLVDDWLFWFRRKLRRDDPYTSMVSEMLEAQGSDQDDPAIAYKLSHHTGEGARLEFAARVAKHLLGVRLLCARCHDHPFDQWKTEDYFGLAAFSARQKIQAGGDGGMMMEAVDRVSLVEGDKGDLEYEGTLYKPKFLFGGEAGPQDDRSKVLAHFMTVKQNTQFPRALANRVWEWLMGRGIVHPVDDFSLINKPSSKSLLETLTRDCIDNNYSIKKLVRGICFSRAYQRSCAGGGAMEKPTFAVQTIRQLSGEQLIQSIQVACTGKPGRDVREAMDLVATLYPSGAVWCEVTPLPGNGRQALLLRNNAKIAEWIRAGSVSSGEAPTEKKVEELFLGTLSRLPGEDEKRRFATFLEAHPGPAGFEDAMWALLNTPEFVTRH